MIPITYDEILEYDWMTTDEIAALEFQKLKALLCHAAATVPYYTECFARSGFDPEGMYSVSQLAQLPLIDKGMILQEDGKFLSNLYAQESRRVVQTGGSTGEPFRIWVAKNQSRQQEAFNWAQWKRIGICPGQPVVAISGIAHQSAPEKTFLNYRSNDAMLWVHRPSKEQSPPWQEIVEAVRTFQPVLIRGFPSLVAEMAQAMVDAGWAPIDSVRGVSLSSEDILPDQRRIIERAFGVHCFGFYGQSEQCVLGMECQDATSYHLYPGHSYVEIVDEQGRVINEPGHIGEVVGTSFLNYAMPLIRYRTGDLAAWDRGPCSCGRAHKRLSHLAGRKRSRIALPDGQTIFFGSDIYDAIWYSPQPFRQIQFIQTCNKSLDINIVPMPECDLEQLRQFVQKALLNSLGGEMQYNVKFVSAVERTARGKYLLFLQKFLQP